MKLIHWGKPSLNKIDKKFLNKSFDSNWISGGYYVEKFENDFSSFINSKKTLTVNNGTSAIYLVYQALDLKKDDEIIFPAYGYMAASNIALQLGCKPIFVDINPGTLCIDPEKIENKITKKTKLIVAINTYGNICDFVSIMSIAKKNNINVLEDAAESLGSTLNKKQAGTFGNFGTFSFQATKAITTGEGGMVTTNRSLNIFNKMKLYRSHGVKKKRFYHILPGSNFRLTNLQASIGYSQLKRINTIKKKRKDIFFLYRDFLKKEKNIEFQKFEKNVDPMIFTLSVTLNPKKKLKRNKIINEMYKRKIETRNGFYSPNNLKIYNKYKDKDLKVSDLMSQNIICLPLYPDLSEKDIIYICRNFIQLIN